MTDPVLKNARREAIIIGLVWATSTLYCCLYSWWAGYGTAEHPLTRADVRPILGIPRWAFWGYLVPWGACTMFTIWFAGFFMSDDDLGVDLAEDLEREIERAGRDV